MSFGASKFDISWLILLFCVINLEFTVCYKCKFENSWRYTCNVIPDSSNIEEKHRDGKTDEGVGRITFNGTVNSVSHVTQSEFPLCQRFKNLERIEVTDVKSVDENLFQQCKNLNDILIENSEINEIKENLLFEHSRLTSISLSFNKLRTLPEDFFINQKELKELFLVDNQISCLPSNIFKSLTKIWRLNLGINKIQSLNPKWFETLQSLALLVLSNNQIQNLPKNVFTRLENLKYLFLDGNQLTTIHWDSFGIHENLWRIDLENNTIKAIDEKFINNIAVREFVMTGNICSDENIRDINEKKQKLSTCFKSYQPRQESSGSIKLCINPTETMTTTIECGTRPFLSIGFILGGTLVNRGEYPWNVALIHRSLGLFCSGTIVSNRHVVTAAHCIKGKYRSHVFGPGDITVMLGVHNYKDQEELGRISAKIKSITIHRHWTTDVPSFDADIAILELANEVQFSNYIRPICLADQYSEIAETSAGTVVGFGKTENESNSDVARKLEISIRDYESCATTSSDHQTFATARMFCGGPADGRGVCSGDSGGGVYVLHNEIFYLRGLVSSSLVNNKLECDTHKQAVFTDVTQYYDWIKLGGLKRNRTRTKRFSFI